MKEAVKEFTPKKFLGLIPEVPRPTDYVAGVNSPLTGPVLLPSGNWTPYVSAGERQNTPFETFNCTAFSLTNVVEAIMNMLIATNQMPQRQKDFLKVSGYLDVDGKVNFSDRALGSWAGTTSAGNRLTTVVDTARKKGLVPDRMHPFGGTNLNQYYALPGQNVIDMGLKFLEQFQINYEWFYNSPGQYIDHIKQSPLYAALCTCGGWNSDDPVNWCNAGDDTNHAIAVVKYDGNSNPTIFDSYPQYLKNLSLNYNIPYALKVFVTMVGADSVLRGLTMLPDKKTQAVYVKITTPIVPIDQIQNAPIDSLALSHDKKTVMYIRKLTSLDDRDKFTDAFKVDPSVVVSSDLL